jgi:hypothetical protein
MFFYSPLRIRIVSVLVAGFVLALTTWAYVQGAGGRWMFDDEYSLSPVVRVVDAASALDYAFSGDSGPSGRPLALASFLANIADWPANPAGFRHLNIAIHLINAILLSWLMLLLTKPGMGARAPWVALTTFALWVVSPFLASSVLSAVQRMTLLAALFVLLGLIGYVWGRLRLAERPMRGLVVMSLALGICSVLGALSKESAILLPLLAGVIEFCLLADQPNRLSRRAWLGWRLLFFAVPILLLVGYTVAGWSGTVRAYHSRPFNLEERLLSEAVILWDYVRNLLVPRARGFGLFHDDVAVLTTSDPVAWMAVSAWAAMIALTLAVGRRQPWLVFGVGGFLVGHLIESTIFPLELYYEHRNYVPAMFLYGGVTALMWQALPKLAPWMSVAFTASYWVLLLSVTSLWGQSDLSAEMWFEAHPNSPRAVQFNAQRLIIEGKHESARQLLAAASDRVPKASDLLLQRLQLDCGVLDPASLRLRTDLTIQQLRTSDRSNAVVQTLLKLKDEIDGGRCSGLSSTALLSAVEAMAANPQFKANSVAMDHLYNFLSHSAWERGDLSKAEAYQRLAYSVMPSPDNAQTLAVWLLSQDKTDAAIEFLRKEVALHSRSFRLRPDDWEKKVGDMLAKLEAVQQAAKHQ